MGLRHWAQGPFELISHAESHLRSGEDFDRRIALISFDNSLKVSITTYLTLNPVLRGNRAYAKADVDKWLHNYHSKLTFLDEELKKRSAAWLGSSTTRARCCSPWMPTRTAHWPPRMPGTRTPRCHPAGPSTPIPSPPPNQ